MVDLTDFLIAYARQPVQAGLAANRPLAGGAAVYPPRSVSRIKTGRDRFAD